MNRAVVLVDHIWTESRRLELTIHIGRDDERIALEMPNQGMQRIKPRMWQGIPVEIQPMAVEPPGKTGILNKLCRSSHGLKVDTKLGKHGICTPESVRPAKIGKAGIHPHACTRNDNKTLGLGYWDFIHCIKIVSVDRYGENGMKKALELTKIHGHLYLHHLCLHHHYHPHRHPIHHRLYDWEQALQANQCPSQSPQ